MQHQPSSTTVDEVADQSSWTRRAILAGLGAGSSALALGALDVSFVGAAVPTPAGTSRPQALGPQLPGLQYLGIDALAFFDQRGRRLYQDLTGSQPDPATPNTRVWAPLALPVGSVIRQVSASYQGQPIIEINRRKLFSGETATAPAQVYQETFQPSPGGAFASTKNLATPVRVEADFAYTVSAYVSAGSSIIAMQIGYHQGFVPFVGPTPRVLDTRESTGKLPVNQELTVDLGMPGASAAIVNLTATGTDGAGFLSAYAANLAWPGNSSVNYSFAGATVANLVVCALDPAGKLKIRAGAAGSQVVVDRIGFFF